MCSQSEGDVYIKEEGVSRKPLRYRRGFKGNIGLDQYLASAALNRFRQPQADH